ncbi:hypothetical protein NDU88_002409 [Pleurodeles waltl]|uniref:Uncharacterized protein n=1 Tax=Pleurodeles waltl TaxID=8319 RepID=A0AAV7UYT5_PLEWA|nr:hypothetical protein NDU88_002409 [Pleurodeles waltl]
MCGADFLHLAWVCRTVQVFWAEVVADLERAMHLHIENVPSHCLLGHIKKVKDRKMRYEFLQLALVLAQRRVPITWMGQRAPVVDKWYRDIQERALPEEVHMKHSRRDDELENDVVVWRAVHDAFFRPRLDVETTDSDDGNTQEEGDMP